MTMSVTPAMMNGEYGGVYKACAEKDAKLKILNDQIKQIDLEKDKVHEQFAIALKASAEARGVPFTAPMHPPKRIEAGDPLPGH